MTKLKLTKILTLVGAFISGAAVIIAGDFVTGAGIIAASISSLEL